MCQGLIFFFLKADRAQSSECRAVTEGSGMYSNLTNKLRVKPEIPGVGRGKKNKKTRLLLVHRVRIGYISQTSDLTALPKWNVLRSQAHLLSNYSSRAGEVAYLLVEAHRACSASWDDWHRGWDREGGGVQMQTGHLVTWGIQLHLFELLPISVHAC